MNEIIPRLTSNDLGKKLSTGLSSYLSNGMDQFGQLKLNKLMNEYNYAPGLRSLGLTDEQARGVSNFDPATMREAIKSTIGGNININAGQRLSPAQQQAIDKANKPALDKINKGLEVDKEIYDATTELYDLLQSGKVSTGFLGGVQSTATNVLGDTGASLSMQNPETQRANQLMKQIVTLESSRIGGARGSDFLRKLVNQGKFNLGQTLSVLLKGVSTANQRSKTRLSRAQAVQDLTELYGYTPPNIEKRIDEFLGMNASSEGLSPVKDKSELDALRGLGSASEGRTAEDQDTGKEYLFKDGQWYQVGEGYAG